MKKSKLSIFFIFTITIISSVSILSFADAQEDSKIPTWIKTAVGFWVNDQITDDEFLKAIEYFVEKEMIKVPAKTVEDNTLINNLQIMQSEINTKIEQSRELVNLPQIQESLTKSNMEFTESGFPEEIIAQVEQRWQSSDPETPNSITFNLINNSAADVLRSVIEIDEKSDTQFKYAEIFVTNIYGANIAQTEKTSDYRQDDELWWQKAKENGIFLSQGGYDESAGVYASDIAIKILDSEGNFIGILKAVVNVESITEKPSQ